MKCRLTVHLSESVHASLTKAAERPGRSKSSIVELALEQFLGGTTASASADESLLRRLDHMSRMMNQMARDGQISLETIGLFVRYYLTITPPLPAVDQEAARALGRERFETFVIQIGRRLATGSRLVAEVMEHLPDLKPDLFSSDVTAPAQAAAPFPRSSNGSEPGHTSVPDDDLGTGDLSRGNDRTGANTGNGSDPNGAREAGIGETGLPGADQDESGHAGTANNGADADADEARHV
jgi:hypothetical protein